MGETDWGKLGLILMGRAMLSKSLIQFSVDGRGCIPSLLFDQRSNYGEPPSKCPMSAQPHSVPLTLQQETANPRLHQRILVTHRKVWVSFLWGHCSWTKMGKFNSDDHYIYHYRQESLRRTGVALIVSKRVWKTVFGCNLKNYRMISTHFQGKHSISQ